MRVRRGLSARLGRLFAVQLIVIGAATVAGIFVTQAVVEDLLTRQALTLEAEHYWQRRAEHDRHPLPDTANMRGYLLSSGSSAPAELEGQPPGFRRLGFEGQSRLVHVSERGGERLYLVFNAGQVSDLAFYFGILPLSVVLLLMYVLLFVAYRWSRAALSPLVRLARELETVDFDRPGGVALDLDAVRTVADAEVATMVDALDRFTSRLDAAIERERLFTRDAGHELRTPLAVFKGSLDLLERDSNRPTHDRRALARMRRTADGMESLLETLLTLAHEEATATDVPVQVNHVVAEEVERLGRPRRGAAQSPGGAGGRHRTGEGAGAGGGGWWLPTCCETLSPTPRTARWRCMSKGAGCASRTPASACQGRNSGAPSIRSIAARPAGRWRKGTGWACPSSAA